ncbi:MAG: hypothetical protein EOP83_18925 [Verrucomicrobiaceae bacterium]|nr:MAG: hypothetical protein EOP83_18925 [Verrucomicrobiaceae bacterium]
MKNFFVVILLVVLCPLCAVVGYLFGHVKGHSLGARMELTSTMIFLTIARSKIEQGENASAVEAIDKGLDAVGNTIMEFEKSGPKTGLMSVAARPGLTEKQMMELRTKIATSLDWQRSPVPEKVYLALKIPVVPGNPLTAISGGKPMIPEEGGAPSPAWSPGSTSSPSPSPNQPQLPPGVERRQR